MLSKKKNNTEKKLSKMCKIQSEHDKKQLQRDKN